MKVNILSIMILLHCLDSFFCGHFDKSFFTHFSGEMMDSATYPVRGLDCVLISNSFFKYFHCEKKVSVKFDELGDFVYVKCNRTLTYAELEYDYSGLIDFFAWPEQRFLLIGCPEPRKSYASHLYPKKYDSIGGEGSGPGKDSYVENNIHTLSIDCERRKAFHLNGSHLQSLKHLKVFKITCPVLTSVPKNLFQGTTPNVERIHISNTRLEYIPNGLFNDLRKLDAVYLNNNLIKRISEKAFVGCNNLATLAIEDNQLEHLEEKLLEAIENVSTLHLSGNRFTKLPNSFKNLSSIEYLRLERNLLEEFGAEYCEGLSGVRKLNLSHNRIAYIHPECFNNMSELYSIDISGNKLSDLTDKPVGLDELKNFYFNDNYKSLLRVKKFFTATNMIDFQIRNSNVISVEDDSLHGFPNLLAVDLSINAIKTIPENFFRRNTLIEKINLSLNEILSIPLGLLSENSRIRYLTVSSNNISSLPQHIFTENCELQILDVSFNSIKRIPERLLTNLTSLQNLNISHNNLTSLGDDFLLGMDNITHLDLSYNQLDQITSELFLPLQADGQIKNIKVRGNRISSLPTLHLTNLEYFDASRNDLETLKNDVFHNLPKLKHLDLSRNSLIEIPIPIVTSSQQLQTADLSHNMLDFIDIETLAEAKVLVSLDLSNNNLFSFDVDVIKYASKLRVLNLSSNSIRCFPCLEEDGLLNSKVRHASLKVLDLSNNGIDLNYSPSFFEEESATWGRVSPFIHFPHLEKLMLSSNSISAMFLDWRINLPDLIYLDLRRNKIRHLTHQDMLFSTTSIHNNSDFGPYPCSHNLTVDLRDNEIRFIELPLRMLKILPKKNETLGVYGHVTMLIEGNPFECGCAVFNLLRVIRYDVVLTSELTRSGRGNWMLPAKLDVGNLSCWTPESIRGKKLNNTEEWIHHLVPLFGFCSVVMGLPEA